MNVIPGEVELGIDVRGIEVASLNRMEEGIKEAAKRISRDRGIQYLREKLSDIPPINMSDAVETGLEQAAKRLKISSRRMLSGAGHDAMSFADICRTGMVFIPCQKGVSHNRAEFTSIASICDGAKVMYEYLKKEAAS